MGVEERESSTQLAAVRDLIDRVEIRELTARYNRAFDDVEPEEFASVFTEDGNLVFDGIRHEGREGLTALVDATGFGFVHVTRDPTIDIDGDAARQLCTLVVCSRQRNRRANPFLMTGRYEDDLLRTPEGWRFSSLVISLDLEIAASADGSGNG